jgi:nitroimidazol reductase NimA-like FMN-containing flavoprotein (pyridoxamine 5'-phosphate oxidase superfamily)
VVCEDAAVPNTTMTRMPEKGVSDVAALHALLDEQYVAHVGVVRDGWPLVVPTGVARDGDRLLVHGSTGSSWMRLLADGAEACVTVTALDAVVVARSTFESSFRYRSAVLFGRFRTLSRSEKQAALDVVVSTFLPGRVAEVRPPTDRELAATLVLALPIEEWSLRVSDKWPEDEPADVAGDAWAGVVPLRTVFGAPQPAPDLRAGVPVPESVRRLVD